MKHVIAVLMLLIGFALPGGCLRAQDASAKEPVVQTERIEGLWSVVGYFGGKLTSELGERLNIKKKEEEQGVPTRVELRLGWFEVARDDVRKPKN